MVEIFFDDMKFPEKLLRHENAVHSTISRENIESTVRQSSRSTECCTELKSERTQ